MELNRYIHRMMLAVDNISEIDKNTIDLLSLFVFNSHLSIYQIFKIIELKKLKAIAYKNIHKKVKKLIRLNLIERVTDSSNISERELEKGAKYYKISEEGIFALFYDSNVLAKPSYYYYDQTFNRKKDSTQKLLNIFLDYKKEIFKNHKDCNFFELFLHPWIGIDTVLNLDEKTIDIIRLFLTDCCNVVKDHVLSFPKGTFQLSIESIDEWSFNNAQELESKDEFDLSALNEGDNLVMEIPSLSFLNQLFSFSFESDKVKVKKTADNDGNHIIIISSVSYYPKNIQFIYNKLEKKLDIISIDEDNLSKISLYAEVNPIKNIKLAMYKALSYSLKKFDFFSLYHKAVFSIAMKNIKNKDLILKDVKFKEMFLNINNKFCRL